MRGQDEPGPTGGWGGHHHPDVGRGTGRGNTPRSVRNSEFRPKKMQIELLLMALVTQARSPLGREKQAVPRLDYVARGGSMKGASGAGCVCVRVWEVSHLLV